jgi:glycine cleavage system H lipoate-binding protein
VFPWIYGFHWTPMHIAFLTIFGGVVAVVGATVIIALRRTRRSLSGSALDKMKWMSEFEDLPLFARACRHQMTGETPSRTCHREFECRKCATHSLFLAKLSPELSADTPDQSLYGLAMPLDRYYHRGHTWVKPSDDGCFTVGLDDLALRMIGRPDQIELPAVGAEISAQGTGWVMKKGNASLRVLAPVDGVVVEQGKEDAGWYLKIRPREDSKTDLTHLLRGTEVRPWILREIERLELTLSPAGLGFSLADGGELVDEMSQQAPEVDWDGVWGAILLQA